MATEANGAAQEAPALNAAPATPSGNPTPEPKPPGPASTPAPAAAEPKKLSNAQLKAQQKAEKAARRAQAKEAKAATASQPSTAGVSADAGSKGNKSVKGGNKQDDQQQQQQQQGRPGIAPRRPSMGGRRGSIGGIFEKDPRSAIPECFSHIPMAKRIPTSQAHKDVHPAVLALGQQMATFTIRDSIARLKYMLLAFRKVIEAYETPKGNSLSRHFIPHVLNDQIEYLTECRPMCFSMGNAIRLLKAKINKFDIDTPEDEAKEAMLESIDNFINERITLAELIIARNAADMIADGDVILTYRQHRLVERALLQARRDGKKFEVSIIDDPFDQTGQMLAKALRNEGIRVYYSPHMGGAQGSIRRATKVFVGAEAIFANGAMQGPAGTCDVCLTAADAGVPVMALCETINFDRDRVATDSLTYNEIDPERCGETEFRLLFDTTREKHVNVVITEFESETGNSPAQSILAILRKQEDPNAG